MEILASSLDRRDRAFLMEIVYGVLRYRDTLDWILGHFLKKTSGLGSMTINNLRTALYQIYFMRVPEWAVVNESVEIEKTVAQKDRTAKPGLVNAVLRNIIRQKDLFAPPLKPDNAGAKDPVEAEIALNTSHPRWMIRRWIKRFGAEEARHLAEANNLRPLLCLRVNTLRTTREGLVDLLRQNGVSSTPALFSPVGVFPDEQVTYEDLSFAQGLFMIQDEASQLIPYLLGPQPGERVLDACAAPGGKTTHIAQMMNDEGDIVATEKDHARTAQLRDNVSSLGLRSIRILNTDVEELREPEAFDRILLDAPCSATGTIRRNPDVKYRHRVADLLQFGEKQSRLLQSVSGLLKKGGTLVYAVCSTEPEEGEQVIDNFLKTNPEFRIIEADAPGLKALMTRDLLRTFPHKNNMDGFFAVSLCRKD